MYRLAMEKLVEWKNKEGRKPLILRGARQVGKTWLMQEFGRKCFAKVAYVNFYNNRRLQRIFEEDFDLQRLLMNINLECRLEVDFKDTLIIFDEIQECPRALESLKFFCENAREYCVVAAGSLLGVAIHGGISFPVGKVESLNIYPMTYKEFLMAMGEQQLAAALDRGDYPLMGDCREKYIFWLKNYYYVGGMPEVVAYFASHKDYQQVRHLQKEILDNYEFDFGKHIDKHDLPRMRLVWHSIPMQLAKENKKFFFGQIKAGSRMKDFEEAIEWLADCSLIHRVYRINKPALPLNAYLDFTAFKLFLHDIGLLSAMGDLEAATILETNAVFTEFKGALTEQYVLQELVAAGYTPYYSAGENGSYEVDFIIQHRGQPLPIEVKANLSLQAKSLKYFLAKYPDLKALLFSMQDYEAQDRVRHIPLYGVCAFPSCY